MASDVSMQSIMNHHLPGYAAHHPLSPQQAKACHRIGVCRTQALGGNILQCRHCEFEQPQYHSCRDRHCPQCQRQAGHDWCERQCQSLLPVTYHHLVFTLPQSLNPWVQLHPEIIYQALFQSAWTTLKRFAQDPRRLDGELGMTAILHTWGQTLGQHIHLHCLVPGGGWNEAQQSWHPAPAHYLFPVKALSRCFRGIMVSTLRRHRQAGTLTRITHDFDSTLNQLMGHEWVVYSKPHLEKPETVVRYLSGYTRKTAIDNRRIVADRDNHITFHYKDYRDHDRHKQMQLSANEFIRRFLLHILPNGFMRIRHYGFLSNRCRKSKLERINTALAHPSDNESDTGIATKKATATHQGATPLSEKEVPCPKCKTGRLRVIYTVLPMRRRSSA